MPTEEEQAQLDFDSGFPAEKPAVEVKIETPVKVEVPPTPPKPEPKYVRVTDDDFKSFKSAAEKTAIF